MAVKPVDADAKLERWFKLRRWLENCGVCWRCSSELAFTQIDREHGAPKDSPGADLSGCMKGDGGVRCRERANANRKAMPR